VPDVRKGSIYIRYMGNNTIFVGSLRRNGDNWELVRGDRHNDTVQLDLAALDRPFEGLPIIDLAPEEAEGSTISVLPLEFDDDAHRLRAKRIVAHDTIGRYAAEIASVQRQQFAHGAQESDEAIWLRAEGELLGIYRALWWGNLGMTTDGGFIFSGNVFGSPRIFGRTFLDSPMGDRDLVTALGQVAVRQFFIPKPNQSLETREFCLILDRLVPHSAIAERAYEISTSGRGGSAEANWQRAEDELLLGVSKRKLLQ
jgi:hypothetical protein